jgi:hypothetical protein
MNKTLNLALNKYPTIPHTLRQDPTKNVARSSVSVDLGTLYHHYYLDSYGQTCPDPDPAQFEHVRFLLPCAEFRFKGSGLGISPAIRRHRSNELGQAFCRWFLQEHFNIPYFAHLESLLNRQMHRAFEGFRIERVSDGDTPDYFCAENVNQVFLAEAKGRYSSVGFGTKEFSAWRQQFTRVVYRDSFGVSHAIKGHIVATRFGTEENSARVNSGIWAEDPESPGERRLTEDSATPIGTAIIAAHYSNIAEKLNQKLLASALASGTPLPREINVNAVVWEVRAGPLQGRRFVGGHFGPSEYFRLLGQRPDGRLIVERSNSLRLDVEPPTFFGLEESIFKQIVEFARTGDTAPPYIQIFSNSAFFYSGFSVLKDGSALAPTEFVEPIGLNTF